MNEPQYQQPADGSPDSADPAFRAKVRACGYCGDEFTTSARWRYFCGRCRQYNVVRFPEADRTVPVSFVRRGGGA